MLWLFYNSQYFHFPSAEHRMLHIAPEPALVSKFRQIPNQVYLSADLNNPKAMVRMDICDIHYPDNSFDIVQCSHVLEHVDDDQKALAEFWRILKPNGSAIVLVPITGPATHEDPSITNPVEREKTFGQFDHLRSYGLDFINRVTKARFRVRAIYPNDLANSRDFVRFGLDPKDIIFLCTKQN